MSEIDTTTTPVAEEKATPETTAEQTIGEVLDSKPETPAEKPVNTVPESAFLKEKMARKEAERKIKELEDRVSKGASHSEVSDDIASIAKEYDIDPSFLDKLTNTIRSKTEREIEDKFSSKFKPIEEKERQEKIDQAFNTHYKVAIERMPEFANVVNPQVIKSLSLLPQNANKTFAQLIEETYGNAITGKRTMETTTSGGGKEPAPLDFARANKDSAYFAEVMGNPKLKAEYNDKMLRGGF